MAQWNEEQKGKTSAGYAESGQGAASAAEAAGEETKQRVQPYFSDRKNRLAEELHQTAEALRESGNQLSDQRGGDLIRMSAEKIEQLGGYLGTRNLDEMIDDLRSFARARPWTVMGGAFIAGLAAARFAKAGGRSGSKTVEPQSVEGAEYADIPPGRI